MILNEDLFDNIIDMPDVEVEVEPDLTVNEIIPEGPQPGIDNGIANLLTGAIADIWNEISQYNSYITTIGNNNPAVVEILKDIVNNKNYQVGQLQSALEKVSPNADLVQQGLADNQSPLDESLNATLNEEVEQPELSGYTSSVNEIIKAINDEWEAISGYNVLKDVLQRNGYENYTNIIDDISKEEATHIGQLQAMLDELNPTIGDIEEGQVEAETQDEEV